jgi:DNA repair protein RadA/Sms
MKAKAGKKTAFFCTNCGAMHHRWQGQCRECGEWNSLHEEAIVASPKSPVKGKSGVEVVTLPEVATEYQDRIVSGLDEFDRVLGGGAVYGSALLIGGEPGIGKSSLLLQIAEKYGERGHKILYISGEESIQQIKDRALRFNIDGRMISVANVSDLDEILSLGRDDYQFIIVDSIQTVASPAFDSPPGTVGQVRESAARLIELAKRTGKIIFLVGHITKDGAVAGPKVLEHMVDTVLYFEGDRFHLYRILRSQKNRFGPAGEIGVFEMTGQGLNEMRNPSQIFMTSTQGAQLPGRVVSAAVEGSRSFLVEVEALVAASPYGTPQRVASGIDSKRLAIINAVLEKRGGVLLGGNDVFVNIAGGIHLDDTALDLAFLLAAASSKLNLIVDAGMLVVGEVGLSGDVRGVSHIDRRLAEAAKLGLKRAMIPVSNSSGLIAPSKMEVIPVGNVDQALQVIR